MAQDDLSSQSNMADRWQEVRERERLWASGVCPDSGMAVHQCHATVCDCFGAKDCMSCSTQPWEGEARCRICRHLDWRSRLNNHDGLCVACRPPTRSER